LINVFTPTSLPFSGAFLCLEPPLAGTKTAPDNYKKLGVY